MDHKDLCEHTRIRLIAAALGHQQCTKTASNIIPLPGTDRVIAIGTPAQVRALLGDSLAAPASAQPAEDPVVEANRQLLLDRSRVGIKKYGVTLANAGLSRSEIAQHALEEALDLANYLQTLIQTDASAQPDRGAAQDEQTLRSMFERDAKTFLGSPMVACTPGFQKDDDGGYQYANTRRWFSFWKAARATVAAPSPASQPVAPEVAQAVDARAMLNADELAALHRFDECAQDGEGYDVPKEMMQRLAEIGVVRRKSGAYYEATDFGQHVLGNAPAAAGPYFANDGREPDWAGYAAAEAGLPDIKELVNRFLGWPMPDSLSARIAPNVTRPIGTHLMNADEAKAMFEHCLQVAAVAPSDAKDAVLESAVQAVADRAGDAETILVVSVFDAIRALKMNRFALPAAPTTVPDHSEREAANAGEHDKRDLEGALKMVAQSRDILASALALSQERVEKLTATIAAAQEAANTKDAALSAWVEAETASREAIEAYNVAVRESDKHIWPGFDTNTEFDAMCKSKNKAFHAMRALYDAAMAAAPSSEKGGNHE